MTYDLTGSGAVAKKFDDSNDTAVEYTLNGDELDEAKITVGSGTPVTNHYEYDEATGDMTCSGATNLTGCVGGVKYSYDGFSRMTLSEDMTTPSADKPGYEYDAFDGATPSASTRPAAAARRMTRTRPSSATSD